MNKRILWPIIGLVCFGVAFAPSQTLRSGETAIYLRNGDLIIDRILDISSARLVLETENNGEFPLRNLWMINFVNDQWNFPDERNQIENADHYVFLKDGGITSGKIVDLSSENRMFDLDSGEKIAFGRVRRIYFSKNVPQALMKDVPVVSEERTEGLFLSRGPAGEKEIILQSGWHPLEADANAPLKKWRWTSGEARCAVNNPRRDAQLFIRGWANKDVIPSQKITLKINNMTLDEFIPEGRIFEKSYSVRGDMLGQNNEFSLTIAVNQTFVPARVIVANRDQRELGVQVSYIYLISH